MPSPSQAEFPSERRVHIGLSVADLARSVDFYGALFDSAPSKRRPDYAKFEIVEPALNLSMAQGKASSTGPTRQQVGFDGAHFGIQVKSGQAVEDMARRLSEAGLETRVERAVGCCYAVQDKVWVTDPDGNAWEVFAVTNNDYERLSPGRDSACCVGTDCTASCSP